MISLFRAGEDSQTGAGVQPQAKGGEFVILDSSDRVTGQTAAMFTYHDKHYTATVHLRRPEDKKKVYVSVCVGLR
jgi:hypothetical protein